MVKSLANCTQTFQKETKAIIKNLEQQFSQLASTVGRLEAQGKLPDNTEKNPRHDVNALYAEIMGNEYDGVEDDGFFDDEIETKEVDPISITKKAKKKEDAEIIELFSKVEEMCKNAVDRSQGQLVDISILYICTNELLQYIADRSSQLKRLEVIYCFTEMYGCWGEALKKLPLLEELGLNAAEISEKDIESVGRYCPMLKTLKVDQEMFYPFSESYDEESITNAMAITIGKNLHNLRHLELVGNTMTNIGLQVILDGCCHLESLDLRRCWYVNLKGDLGKKCSQQIKYLKLPRDSLEGLPHRYENANETCDVLDYSDTDDYTDIW